MLLLALGHGTAGSFSVFQPAQQARWMNISHPTPAAATISSGLIFNDTAGQLVHAHGAGLITPASHPAGIASGRYYLVGTSRKLAPDWLSLGVNIYSSYDLEHWEYEGVAFNASQITTTWQGTRPAQYRLERPKILFNEKTATYVMCKPSRDHQTARSNLIEAPIDGTVPHNRTRMPLCEYC